MLAENKLFLFLHTACSWILNRHLKPLHLKKCLLSTLTIAHENILLTTSVVDVVDLGNVARTALNSAISTSLQAFTKLSLQLYRHIDIYETTYTQVKTQTYAHISRYIFRYRQARICGPSGHMKTLVPTQMT